ncbi:hypothetical protein [Nocardioides sp.]|uniref:hypothetical protein n=1 Tax=Nocardioides sp. TaxID=35761 RepID=UPI003566D1F1
MDRRVIGFFLVLLLLGAGAGYAWGALTPEQPLEFEGARPLPAASPSFPFETEAPYAQDVDFPSLAPDLTYVRNRLGEDPFAYTYRRPKGWSSSGIGAGEVTFSPPDGIEGGYGMRVKLVNARMTPEEMVAQKLAALQSTEDDVQIVGRSSDTLAITYRSSANRLRYNTFRWFTDTGGGFATFETSVYGRAQDVPGLTDLLDQVSASIRRS